METQDILFEELEGAGGNLGVMTLNRPAVLNSLNYDMIAAMHLKLNAWAESSAIKAVVIRAAEGRAFCAGGDIRVVYERARHHNPLMTEFFYHEYNLNRCIHHYPKPYIALLDGITMGGGVGVSIHGSHRVATDKVLFAMPETGIGFFPDVGGTYFLPRLPSALGYYLGLTGARLKIDDCMALGITTHHVSQQSLSEIIRVLQESAFEGDAKQFVSTLLAPFSIANNNQTELQLAQADLQTCFSHNSIDAILAATQSSSNPVCREAAAMLEKKSPTSLKVTLQALTNGKNMSFDACMQQEFRLVTRFLLAHDFIEGIRAAIIDKDQKPVWKPDTLNAVSSAVVDDYFAPLQRELA